MENTDWPPSRGPFSFARRQLDDQFIKLFKEAHPDDQLLLLHKMQRMALRHMTKALKARGLEPLPLEEEDE